MGDLFQLHLNTAFFSLSQASMAAVATVSQLLDGSETEFNQNNVNVTTR